MGVCEGAGGYRDVNLHSCLLSLPVVFFSDVYVFKYPLQFLHTGRQRAQPGGWVSRGLRKCPAWITQNWFFPLKTYACPRFPPIPILSRCRDERAQRHQREKPGWGISLVTSPERFK